MEPGHIAKVYIASTLSNAERVSALAIALWQAGQARGLDITITYDWTPGGYVPDDQPDLKRSVAIKELLGVLNAHVLLVVMPGERGSHFEFGVAYAVQKPIVLLLDRHDGRSPSFHFLDNIVRAHREDDAIDAVLDLLVRPPALDRPDDKHLMTRLLEGTTDDQCHHD